MTNTYGKVYTLQCDTHGNLIVCGDTVPRNGYDVIDVGTYDEMVSVKYAGESK